MNFTPSQAFRKQIAKVLQDVMDECDIWKTCINCKHFVEQTELCMLSVPPLRPPARIITFGCNAFLDVDSDKAVAPPKQPKVADDDIPF